MITTKFDAPKVVGKRKLNLPDTAFESEIQHYGNALIQASKENIFEFAKDIDLLTNANYKLMEYLSGKVELQVINLKYDYDRIKKYVNPKYLVGSIAFAFCMPEENLNILYIKFDNKTINQIKNIMNMFGYEDIKQTIISIFDHESIHSFYCSLDKSESMDVFLKRKKLHSDLNEWKKLLFAKFLKHSDKTTNLNIYADVIKNQNIEEAITWGLTNENIIKDLIEFDKKNNLDLTKELFDIIKQYDINGVMKHYIETKFQPESTEKVEKEMETEVKIDANILIGDEWFNQNPSKELGGKRKKSTQYGKIEDVVVGNIEEEIKKIPADLPEAIVKDDDLEMETAIDGKTREDKIEESIIDIDKRIIGSVVKKGRKEKEEKEKKKYEELTADAEIYTFSESVKMYNPQISDIEMEAYFFCNPRENHKLFFNEFKHTQQDYLNHKIDLYTESGNGKSQIIKARCMYPVRENEFEYFATYLSGNINEKIKLLWDNQVWIAEQYGSEFLEEQRSLLLKIQPEFKRLNDPNEAERPVILVHTKLCKQVKVEELKTGEIFNGGLSVIGAFVSWLREHYQPLEYDGVMANEIENYINNEDFYYADKGSDKAYKKEIERKNAEAYQRSKIAGDKAFAKFLSEIISDKAREELETKWNERFNNYVYPNLNKIPIGFTHGKKFLTRQAPLILSDTQRNSIAYTKLKGSALLAYDVGVGKTLSAIMNISYSLETGGCRKPLLVVPNMVYNKWITEIQNTKIVDPETQEEKISYGSLPHLPPVFELFNLNTKFVFENVRDYTEDELERMSNLTQQSLVIEELLEKYPYTKEIVPIEIETKTGKIKTIKKEKIIIDLEKIKDKQILTAEFFSQDLIMDVIKNLDSEFRKLLTQDDKISWSEIFVSFLPDEKIESNKTKRLIIAKIQFIKSIIHFYKKFHEYLVFTLGKIKPAPENTIYIMTYEGFARFGFSPAVKEKLAEDLFTILTQGQDVYNQYGEIDAKKVGKWQQKISKVIGQSKRNAKIEFDEFGFDYLVIDEAHNMKKIFTYVSQEAQGKDEDSAFEESKKRYKLQTGNPSTRGLKAFCITHWIQHINDGRNCLLLTATPFTNSPLEIYSMLSLTNHNLMVEYGFQGLKEFFDYFIRTEFGITFDAKNQPIKKEEVVGFVNLFSLRNIIYKVIDYKTGEDANIQRPCLIPLPLKDTSVICRETEEEIELPVIETIIKPNDEQKKMMLEVENYMTGDDIDLDVLDIGEDGDIAIDETIVEEESETEDTDISTEENITDIEVKALDERESEFVRIMRGLAFMRSITLSPYLYKGNPTRTIPTPNQLVETSPKIKYIMDCIKGIRKYQKENKTKISNFIIYCNLGTNKESFGFSVLEKMRDYMIDSKNEMGFDKDEIALIYSKVTKPRRKDIQKNFNAGKIKVIIGSATIKEGIDLQTKTSGLFNLTVDWNPTDAKQIEGRGWRQGNEKAYFFTNYVLLADSSDIVYFQKLQDKTMRIKEIWDRIGRKNQLDLKDFDPRRIKMDLLTRADKIAQIEVDIEIEKIDLERRLIYAKLTELRKAKENVSSYLENKPIIVEKLEALEAGIVNYRRSLREKQKQEKIAEINEAILNRENEKTEVIKDKEKEVAEVKSELSEYALKLIDVENDEEKQKLQKEVEKLKDKISKINEEKKDKISKIDEKIKDLQEKITTTYGVEFDKQTDEMFKIEHDYKNMPDNEIDEEVKKVADRFKYGGTYWKYIEDDRQEWLQYYKNLFDLSYGRSPASQFRFTWRKAKYYNDRYFIPLNLSIENIDSYIDDIIKETDKFDEQIANIKLTLPERTERIKEEIRRKTDKYKDVDGRVKEFGVIHKLLDKPSGFAIAKENKLIPHTEVREEIEVADPEQKKVNLEKRIKAIQFIIKKTQEENKKKNLEKRIKAIQFIIKKVK